jgi:hypothetical protein
LPAENARSTDHRNGGNDSSATAARRTGHHGHIRDHGCPSSSAIKAAIEKSGITDPVQQERLAARRVDAVRARRAGRELTADRH